MAERVLKHYLTSKSYVADLLGKVVAAIVVRKRRA